jgi:hypothetical protein
MTTASSIIMINRINHYDCVNIIGQYYKTAYTGQDTYIMLR